MSHPSLAQEFAQLVQHLHSHLKEGMPSYLPVNRKLYQRLTNKPSPPLSTPPKPPRSPPIAPPPTHSPPLRKKAAAERKETSTASFSLQRTLNTPSPPNEQWGEVLRQVAPRVTLLPPPLLPAKETSKEDAALLLLHTHVSAEGIAFLHHFAQAMQERGYPVQLWNVDDQGDGFASCKNIRAILVTRQTMEKLSRVLLTEGEEMRLGDSPLILMDAPENYLLEPSRKRSLWNQLKKYL